MKPQELTLLAVLICVSLLMGWMFLIYSPLRTQTQEAENMIDTIQKRIKTRAALPEPPAVSEPKLQAELEELEEIRDQYLDQVEVREARFVSLDTIDGIRELRFLIANLAEQSGLDVKRFGTLNDEGEVADSLEAMRGNIVEPYGRPVLNFEAKGGYPQITKFVDSLSDLDNSVAIIRLTMKAPSFEQMLKDAREGRLLTIYMDLAL